MTEQPSNNAMAPHTFCIYPSGHAMNEERYRKLKTVLELKFPEVKDNGVKQLRSPSKVPIKG